MQFLQVPFSNFAHPAAHGFLSEVMRVMNYDFGVPHSCSWHIDILCSVHYQFSGNLSAPHPLQVQHRRARLAERSRESDTPLALDGHFASLYRLTAIHAEPFSAVCAWA